MSPKISERNPFVPVAPVLLNQDFACVWAWVSQASSVPAEGLKAARHPRPMLDSGLEVKAFESQLTSRGRAQLNRRSRPWAPMKART